MTKANPKELAELWAKVPDVAATQHQDVMTIRTLARALLDSLKREEQATAEAGWRPTRERIKRAIMLKVQGNEFGHWERSSVALSDGTRDDEDHFVTTGAEIDLLDKVCSEAADAILALAPIRATKEKEEV